MDTPVASSCQLFVHSSTISSLLLLSQHFDHLPLSLLPLCSAAAAAAGDGVHILTGPIYVCGAEPGDVLQVRPC